jgi:uncharacterized protein YgbK (DUF1537 family)
MLLGVIADDFTGASDIGNTLAKGLPGQGGLRTAQFLGVPPSPAPGDVEAGVVALKSRSIPAGEAVAQSLAALEWLRAQGCQQFIFKYCSTFDSTPGGNIGPVGEALAETLGVKGVIVCPAFPAVGRTVYQGHLFVKDRLLNESGLQNHPLNPMTDPDIRRWLARQTTTPVGLVALATVSSGHLALATALEEAAQNGQTLIIVDAVGDEDLITIGKAAALAPLITGGSGVALGLPANFIAAGLASGSGDVAMGVKGPEAILAGSCSGATRKQIEVHARAHPVLALDVERVVAGEVTPESLVAFVESHRDRAPLVFSGGTPQEVAALQHRFGREQIAEKLDTLFAETAKMMIKRGTKRLVVAGGETSGAVVSALELGALNIGREIDPGVPALYSHGNEPIALALKSGNFGSPDFFAKALARLEGR